MTEHNITVYPNMHFGPLFLDCKDVDGVTYDLTGWDVEAHIRRPSDGILLLDLTPVISDPMNGVIRLEITEADTDDLIYDEYAVWDLVVLTPSGLRIGPIVGGVVSILRPATQFA